MKHKFDDFPVRRLTDGYYYHFFGYYDKSNWDKTNRYLLCLRTAPFKRYMRVEDIAVAGILDSHDSFRFRPVTQTTAWNWQQGSQSTWLDNFEEGAHFILNVQTAKGYGSAIVNAVKPNDEMLLPLPIYSVTNDSRHALCLNYHRLRHVHSTIVYAEKSAPFPEPHPKEDGLFLMDIPSGNNRLIISIDRMRRLGYHPSMDEACHWITHVNPNNAGNRVVFLHRFRKQDGNGSFLSCRLVTANLDGSEIRVLESDTAPFSKRYSLSHPCWFGDKHVMVWHQINGRYQLYSDTGAEVRAVGENRLRRNGHFSQCPANPDWMITDTYPDEDNRQTLLLGQLSSGEILEVASFSHDPQISGDTRCDLHPRWSRDGKSISLDSSHNGDRQMFLVDVSRGPHLCVS